MEQLRKLETAAHSNSCHVKQSQHSIQAALQSFIIELPSTALLDPTICQLINKVQTGLGTISTAVKDIENHIPSMYRKSKKADGLSKKVFATPELLEHILGHLDTTSILKASQVCRQFSDTIAGSLHVQRKVGLRPNPKANLYFAPSGPSKFAFVANTDVKQKDSRNLVHVDVSLRYDRYEAAGARLRLLLVCQPQVKEVDVLADCCMHRYPQYRHCKIERKLKSTTGITLGQIIDTTLAIAVKHRICPHAEPFQHDMDGFVHPIVTFEATFEVTDEEPVVAMRGKADERVGALDRVRCDKKDRLQPYVAEKTRASAAHEKILKLAEYEAAVADVMDAEK